MSLTKQAKTLTPKQVKNVSTYLRQNRNGLRNQTIFLLSVKSGLRSKEISCLTWRDVMDSDGTIGNVIDLPNTSSKGKTSGRTIPLHPDLQKNLMEMYQDLKYVPKPSDHIIRTERSKRTSPQVIVNMFFHWYKDLGLVGLSSHSGRRTFITETSRKVNTVGGSLRDIQLMVGHSSLRTTQRYIEQDPESQRKVVNLL